MERRSQGNRVGNRFDYEKAYEEAGRPSSRQKSQSAAAGSRRYSDQTDTTSHTSARREAARKRRRRKQIQRLVILAVIAVLVIVGIIVLLVTCGKKKEPEEVIEEGIPILETQLQKATVEELYTYGTHLNMTGTLPAEVTGEFAHLETDLVLYNGDFISVPLKISDSQFTLSEYVNGGLYLDDIPRDTYTMFIRLTSTEPFEEETEETTVEPEETENETQAADGTEATTVRRIEKKKPDEPTTMETAESEGEEELAEGETRPEPVYYYRYYAISNTSDYPETVYYTMSGYGNRITIDTESEYPTMQMEVVRNTDPDVYDIVIDPGHGGYDAGAIGIDDFCERDFTLPLSLKIKQKLEAAGFKVALTRDSDANLLEPYGPDGRIARACSKHGKYLVSIHMNSTGAGGLEIYTASGIDYTFAELLRDSIKQYSGLGDTLTMGTSLTDIFSRSFTQADIEATIEENIADGLKPYEPTLRSSYFFVIRETGGIATGAYTDDRNPDQPYNPYCYSNVCLESYITELGYITVREDLELMQKNMDGFAKGIADSFINFCGEQDAAQADQTDGTAQTGESPEAGETAETAESAETEGQAETGESATDQN